MSHYGRRENFLNKKMKIETLEAGEYSCIQVELKPDVDIEKIIRENWPNEENITIVVDNVMFEKYSFETRPSELRKLEKTYDIEK